MNRRFQWYILCTEILSTSTRVEYISVFKKYAIQTNGAKNSWNLLFPLRHVDPSNTLIPPKTPLTTPKTARLVHAILHNYTTKSPLVTMGCPKFTPKTAPSPSTISTQSYNLIPRPTPLTTPNGIRSNQPFCNNTLSRPTDKQTDRRNRQQLCINSNYAHALWIVSDALIMLLNKQTNL